MKLRFLPSFIVCVIGAAAVFGGIKRQGYTDLVNEENYLYQLQVAELPEKLAIDSCNELSKALPASSIILRVLVTEDIEHLFKGGHQKVQVQEIYAGSDLKIGQEIYLTFKSWSLILDDNPNSCERGFVNVMKVGYEYLVFISDKKESLDDSVPVYGLNESSFIAPVFCYEVMTNVVVPTEGELTYVPYLQVKDNEFFSASEAGLAAWENLKSEMISLYPKEG